MKFYAIIVAGGSGNRMKAEVPKQFLLLNEKPVLMHTIEAFYLSELRPEIILVLNDQYHIFWGDLCSQYHFEIPHKLVKGGKERFNSVKNALQLVDAESVVAVHDAVRPVITNELIVRCFKEAEINGSAIPVTQSRDSLRKIEGDLTKTVPREEIVLVQTPQVFQSSLLLSAYTQDYSDEFTDDASVVEKSGNKVHITAGDQMNIKITYPEDLGVASLFLNLKHKKSG